MQRSAAGRAEAVRGWFVNHGLGQVRFSVTGFGETRPVAANTTPSGADNPEGRQRNRRVDIVIAKRR